MDRVGLISISALKMEPKLKDRNIYIVYYYLVTYYKYVNNQHDGLQI